MSAKVGDIRCWLLYGQIAGRSVWSLKISSIGVEVGYTAEVALEFDDMDHLAISFLLNKKELGPSE